MDNHARVSTAMLMALPLATVYLASCGEEAASALVPAEIIGTWEADNSAGCTETWIFSANSLNWLQYCPLTGGRDDVDYPFEDTNPTYDALYASNDYWFVYHVVSATQITVRRYDGDTDLATLGNWWETRGITVTKQ